MALTVHVSMCKSYFLLFVSGPRKFILNIHNYMINNRCSFWSICTWKFKFNTWITEIISPIRAVWALTQLLSNSKSYRTPSLMMESWLRKHVYRAFNWAFIFQHISSRNRTSGRQKGKTSLCFAPNYELKFPQKRINWRQSWWLMKGKPGLLEPKNAPSHHAATNARLEVVMLPISIWREGHLVWDRNLKLCHSSGFLWIPSVCLNVAKTKMLFSFENCLFGIH